MTLPPEKIGYKDQKYKVCYTDINGKECIVGWTNNSNGGKLLEGTEMHPSWKHGNPRVIEVLTERDKK